MWRRNPTWTVFCSGCSLKLDEDPEAELGSSPPCPECGTRTRYMRWTGPNSGRILIDDKAAKKPVQRKPSSEMRVGDIVSSEGRELRIRRLIDRRRNLYYEKIHDPETREVLREVEEPLSEHRGRGDARRSKR